MTDPTRLLSGGTDLAKAILRAADDDLPPADLRRKIQASALVASAATSAATGVVAATTGTKTSSFLASLTVTKWVGVLAVGAVVAVGANQVARSRPSTIRGGAAASPTSAPRAQASGATAVSPLARNIPPIPDLADAPVIAATVPEAPVSRARLAPPQDPEAAVGSPAPASSAMDVEDFSREVVDLDLARAALERSDIAATIEAVNRHDLAYPHGHLRPEALAIRIQAYAARHDAVRVRDLASQFLAQYPSHPFAARVSAIVETAGK